MATITGLTKARMLAMEAATIISGAIVGNDLILTKRDTSTVNAGNVRGPQGLSAVQTAGLRAARPAANAVAANAIYYATNNGISYQSDGVATWTAIGWQALPVTGGAVLPTVPAPEDGQLVDYVADTANGIVWRFRYRAASASTFKWESVGLGAPLYAEDEPDRSTAAPHNVYQAVGSDPSVTCPLRGDYMVGIGARGYASSTAADLFLSFSIAAAVALDTDAAWGTIAGTTGVDNLTRMKKKTGILAGSALTMKVRTAINGAGGGAVSKRFITASPIRVI